MMKRRIAELLVLVMVALGAGPVGAAVWQWSLTSGLNSNADPSINWSEGMSPSSVNDSARAMMSAVAGWRNDMSGATLSTGTSTAYALATNQGYTATPPDGIKVSLAAHVTNGASPTLAVDGGTAYPILVSQSTPAPAGTLVAGTPYNLTLRSGSWYMQDVVGNPYSVALGAYMTSSMPSAPNSSFVAANGQCISRTTYATYFAAVGTTYGACDGATTFAVPDVRGRTMAMLDGGTGRLTNSANGCGVTFNTLGVVCGNESQTLSTTQMPSHYHSASIYDPTHSHVYNYTQAGGNQGGGGAFGFNIVSASTSASATGVRVNSSNGIDTTYSAGGGGAHPIVQPTYAVNVFVRVI